MKKIIAIILTALTVICLFCSCDNPQTAKDGLKIVCTTFPQYDFTKNIAGDKAAITMLDSTSDIHSFEPTAEDIFEIADADIFIYIGGESDKWVDKAIKSSGNKELLAISLMECVESVDEETVSGMQDDGEEETETEADEHIWLSLKNAKLMVKYICENLCSIDSENASFYTGNADSYIKKLDGLDAAYSEAVASAKRKTVLFADRFPFRYLVEDYGIEYYAAFRGCSSETAASFETVAFLIEKVKELSLPVILVTESSDGTISKTVCSETGAKTAVMDSCQSVRVKDIENGANYIDIMTSNLEVLREALG